jgi:hypothetical protein
LQSAVPTFSADASVYGFIVFVPVLFKEGANEKAARLRRPLSELDLTNGDDVANHNDDLDHRDGPNRAPGRLNCQFWS